MDGTGFGGLTRVAVLVDGDNFPVQHFGAVMAEAGRLGRVDVRRVYGNAALCGGWDGFRIVHAGGAKNSADMFLVVDAMALALSEGIGAFVIASSDSDITPLALALRERGAMVVGLGGSLAPQRLRVVCGRFVEVAPVAPKEVKPAPLIPPEVVRVCDVIRSNGWASEGALLIHVGHKYGRLPEGVKTWRQFFAKWPDYFDCEPKGVGARVRLTRAGKALLGDAAKMKADVAAG